MSAWSLYPTFEVGQVDPCAAESCRDIAGSTKGGIGRPGRQSGDALGGGAALGRPRQLRRSSDRSVNCSHAVSASVRAA
jgi:hypothetical protein